MAMASRLALRQAAASARATPLQQCRYLHSTTTSNATPIPHQTFVGPPPAAPRASASYPQDRIRQKKQQAEALRAAQSAKVDPKYPKSALQKRFWKAVSVEEVPKGFEVHLDRRPVRTSTKEVLVLPKTRRALANAIALEWDQLISAQQALKNHYIPLTSLSSRANDILASDVQHGASSNPIRQSIVELALRYLGTDTLLCWAPSKNIHEEFELPKTEVPRQNLRERQRAVAEPIIGFLTTHVFPGVEIAPILEDDSIIPRSQPDATVQVVQTWVAGLPAYELAAIEKGIMASKSFLVAARLVAEWSVELGMRRDGVTRSRFGIEEAAEAVELEVAHQTEQWGEVEDTHDVDREDLRRQLGSVVLLVA